MPIYPDHRQSQPNIMQWIPTRQIAQQMDRLQALEEKKNRMNTKRSKTQEQESK
mgnify:CR=1 FL=1